MISYNQFPTIKLTILLGAFVSCTNSPQIDDLENANERNDINEFASPDEPGERLIIYGVVLDNSTNNPISNASIYFYQADDNGEYHPTDPNDESTAKLSGEIVTGENGKFILHTILPGEYNMPGNKHIHIHYARAEGYKEIGKVILFEDNVNSEVRQWANETGFGIIIDLKEENETFIGNLTIPLIPD
jgi:protocatechuate 3,4-dioxygenase beta subunit